VGSESSSLRTFLIADVRGYTRYTHEHGDESAARVAARFAELARVGIHEHDGELLELRGDEALCVFGSARDALRAAVELQKLFRASNAADPFPLGVGIGLDAGEAVPVEGGYRGGALNLAARLCSRAAAGEILVSETVVSLARQIDGMRFQSRGAKRLKGLEQPVEIIEVVPLTRLGAVPRQRLSALSRFRRRHVTGRTTVAAILVALMAAGVASGFTLLGGVNQAASTPSARVALIRPWDPGLSGGAEDPFRPIVEGFMEAEREYQLETETIDLFPRRPPLGPYEPGSRADVERLSDRLRTGDFDLVLWPAGPPGPRFFDVIDLHPETRFLFLHFCCVESAELGGALNVTGLSARADQAAHLAGYLSGLVEARRPLSEGGRHMVSIVSGEPNFAEQRAMVRGFVRGATRALPGVRVRVDYSYEYENSAKCEAIANQQLDAGSRVVFPTAGNCAAGALAAAGLHGVWAVAAGAEDRSRLGPHILASMVLRSDLLAKVGVSWFLEDRLPHGQDVQVGLAQDVVGLVGISSDVPLEIRRRVAEEAARLRAGEIGKQANRN
jgi:class 3 adenylate cyclase/basic membrane lipoprotein Med (substrate-binding protein (PBP1-ABC) superfamily)